MSGAPANPHRGETVLVLAGQPLVLRPSFAALVAAEPDEPWLIWCGLNDEADLLARLAGDSRLPLTRDQLDTLIAEPMEFTGAARNALLPVVTMAGLELGDLISSAVVIERL